MKNGKKKTVFDTTVCYVCDSPYVQVHHIFYGRKNRKNADRYGYVIGLCMEHHIGKTGVHFNKALDTLLKTKAQMHFEEYVGDRDEFRKLFGKSLL